jgi:hypothetical protein
MKMFIIILVKFIVDEKYFMIWSLMKGMCVCANVFWYVQISVGFWCQIPTRYQGKYIDS